MSLGISVFRHRCEGYPNKLNNVSRESGRDFNPVKWVLKGLKRVKYDRIRLFLPGFHAGDRGVRIPLGEMTLFFIALYLKADFYRLEAF